VRFVSPETLQEYNSKSESVNVNVRKWHPIQPFTSPLLLCQFKLENSFLAEKVAQFALGGSDRILRSNSESWDAIL